MTIARIIAVLLLSFSVALTGFSVQAMPQMKDSPIAKHAMGNHDCCPKADHNSQKKSSSGCCDDTACNIKCSSGSMSMPFPAKGDLPQLTRQAPQFYPAGAMLASQLLNTQDRPPKSLS